MGKHRQGRQSNNDDGVNNFKWGRMFNVLDYHRWHYVNKVIPHKKHHVHHVTFSSEDDSNLVVCEKDKCIKNEVMNSQLEAKKLEVNNASNNIGLPWSPKSKGFWSVPISPKSSRIARIKKSIVKEVTKRKGRHRRSSTCPTDSVLQNNGISEQHIKNSNIEQFDDTKLVLQDHANLAINHFLYNKGRRRKSWSFHHSKEFINVVSTSLDDPSPSSRDNLLTKLATSCYNTKSLTKASSFPPQEVINANQSSSVSLFKPMIPEETVDSRRSGQFIGRRFKDLRHKIRNLIKENKKERQRIAMDAVLHKVPYGRKIKISDEGGDKESLCLDISEVDPLICQKNRKSFKRRSPSLDGSIEKYCQLFQATSFSGEAQMDTREKSNLKVVDDPMTNKKRFERMFSSPDLQVFLNHPLDDYHDNVFSRTPNRRLLTSLSSKKVENLENIYIDTAKEFQTTQEFECTNLEDCESYTSEETLSSSLDKDEENKMLQQNDNMIVDVVQPTLTTLGSFSEKNLDEFEGSSFEDYESTQLQELSTDDGVKIPTQHTYISVDDHKREEFKYVQDILTLSGYLGTKVIGTWYSLQQPLDPSMFVQLESQTSSNPNNNNNHLLLFDMINEALLLIYERCVSYWSAPLCSCSRIQLVPKGYHVLEEVWNYIYWYICCSIHPHLDSSLNYITTRDFDKDDGWMNLQLDAHCVGLHLADLIFDDLLIELV